MSNEQPARESEFMAQVQNEVRRSRAKHPGDDPIEAVVMLEKELNEAVAGVMFKQLPSAVRVELAEIAALALRLAVDFTPAPQARFGAEPGFYPLFPEE
jgi:hypothetical protein